jgi:hypothetical protein
MMSNRLNVRMLVGATSSIASSKAASILAIALSEKALVCAAQR